ncbi:NAD(P)H-dependent oxidoreductase [Teichococcus vastitatis]|uniref:NAD(P)H-dependent oxidoreductase n=1 Tax=Teichococcus vastitatis TaxID=2307076 RepID=A0ABS9W6X4_9PROT|nr:NAD(P)H-dependent oxidoreductase [Pseudoroseomonas vastitatis]MCI0755037.1 NAD(P)H-dependent oxidoreductase [Pseudoroseomonas vastitatis]
MSRTLILFFHPAPSHSKANVALLAAAWPLPGVEIADMGALYPDGAIDTEAEVGRLLAADRLVLQFPVQWYATPPLLKAWQDAVLTWLFYIRPEEGARLRGLPVTLAATAGNVPEAYGPAGANLYPLEELLRPLEATAHRCGMIWSRPFLLYRANKLTAEELAAAGEAYAAHLKRWIAATAEAVSARKPSLRTLAEA